MKRNLFLVWSALLVMAALVVRVEALPPPTPPSHAKDSQAPRTPTSASDRSAVILQKDGVTLHTVEENRSESLPADLKTLPSVSAPPPEIGPVATSVTPAPHGISTAASGGYGAMGLVLVLVSMLASRRSGRDDS